jgi:hypothetical protein
MTAVKTSISPLSCVNTYTKYDAYHNTIAVLDRYHGIA